MIQSLTSKRVFHRPLPHIGNFAGTPCQDASCCSRGKRCTSSDTTLARRKAKEPLSKLGPGEVWAVAQLMTPHGPHQNSVAEHHAHRRVSMIRMTRMRIGHWVSKNHWGALTFPTVQLNMDESGNPLKGPCISHCPIEHG